MSNSPIQRNGPNDRPKIDINQVVRQVPGVVRQDTSRVIGPQGAPNSGKMPQVLRNILGKR